MPSRRDLANAIRFLAIDAVQQANSGHPGMPMGMADIAEVLWNDFLKFNPANPQWADRDRFIVSNGHGCMLHYALLHLAGFNLSIDDIKNFRQWGSPTPGHPEYGHTPGIETTTGPLGQGLANAVGMALAEKLLATQFNRPGFELINHYTYVFCGDGCLMEGISHEACSLAGTMGLDKLIVFYDANSISIDGDCQAWFSDDTAKRFAAYHWHVVEAVDGHDAGAIQAAIKAAHAETARPTLIICHTHIGFGSPNKVDTAGVHGSPLGADEMALTRQALNWPHSAFEIPESIYAAYDARTRGGDAEQSWNALFAKYENEFPELAAQFLRRQGGFLPEEFTQAIDEFITASVSEQGAIATRKASGKCIEVIAPHLPELVGGSADLTGSNNTDWSGTTMINPKNFTGNYIHYGVREFGMSAIANGLALHRGIIPYVGTFLVFADYARNAIRLSAMMQARVIYVLTHDSIGLGEDGPTHQPIEHLPMLRNTPGLQVWRPCNVVETAVAWRESLNLNGPSALILSRQSIPAVTTATPDLLARGGYIIKETTNPIAILIATGSEVPLAVAAADQLAAEGLAVRVVSMPCVERFLAQDQSYRDAVLPPEIGARIALEMGSSAFWYQFVGDRGAVIGIDQFGASAPAATLIENYGFTAANVIQHLKRLMTNTAV